MAHATDPANEVSTKDQGQIERAQQGQGEIPPEVELENEAME